MGSQGATNVSGGLESPFIPGASVPFETFGALERTTLVRGKVRLSGFWTLLESGTCAVIAHDFSRTRCSAVLRLNAHLGAGPSKRQADVVCRVVSGECQNAIAIDLGVSSAAVAMRTRRFIRRIGLDCRVSSLPLFVVMASLAHRDSSLDRVVRVTRPGSTQEE